jgi:hypothetical protein
MDLNRAGAAASWAVRYVAAGVTGQRRRRRRPPDLARMTAQPDFRALSSAAAVRIAGYLTAVQADAPWLDRAGEDVSEWCLTSGSAPAIFQEPVMSVGCTRVVAVFYGLDGELGARLGQVAEILDRHGWSGFESAPAAGAAPPVSGQRGRPAATRPDPTWPALPYTTIKVGWASPGDELGPLTALAATRPGSAEVTPFYQPLRQDPADARTLADAILAGHDHVLAARISETYFSATSTAAKAMADGRPGQKIG